MRVEISTDAVQVQRDNTPRHNNGCQDVNIEWEQVSEDGSREDGGAGGRTGEGESWRGRGGGARVGRAGN